jgi:DnaK suppressor protein
MTTPPDELDGEGVRVELETRRDGNRAKITALTRRPELGSAQGFGKRIGDGTVEAISRLTEIGVGESLESSLARTERALAKLDEGSYGRCDACGASIGPERLKARPESVLCIDCASAAQRSPAPKRR